MKKTRILKSGHIDVKCPFSIGLCGAWCPLFVETEINPGNTYCANYVKAVQILCGCQPVTFEIVEDERK